MKLENKKLIIVLSVIILIIILSLLLISNRNNLAGQVAYANYGCCDLLCQETSLAECPNNFHSGQDCSNIEQCNVGCCIDYEDYCLDNYLQSNCQDKGTFVTTSCMNVPQCVTEKQKWDMVQSVGHPVIYNQDSLIYSEPNTAKLGLPLIINTILFDHENISDIDVQITSEGFSENITLYDDGNHGDGNEKDGSYAAVWNNKNVPAFNGIKEFTISRGESSNKIMLSSTDCLPLNVATSNGSKNIIFIGYEENTGLSIFKEKAQNLASMVLNIAAQKIENIESIKEYYSKNDYGYYAVTKNIKQFSKKDIINLVLNQCNFLFNQTLNNNSEQIKNTILFLDQDYPYCEKNQDFIHVNPEFIVNESINDKSINQNDFVDNFCNYVITKQELQEKYMANTIPPHIKINDLNLNEIDNPKIDLDFTIYDNKNETINYTIYLDLDHPLMYLHQGKTINGTDINLELSVLDGKHILWIEAEDSDGNLELSKAIAIEKRANDFIVLIESLDKISHLESPEVIFKVLHKEPDFNLNYELHVNEEIVDSGEVKPLFKKTLTTELPPGEHEIYVSVTDQNGNNAHSWPYYIVVGTDTEPDTYPANVEWYEE